MAQLDLTSYGAALKTAYAPRFLSMVYETNPFFALVPKNEKMLGDFTKVPVRIGAPQNTSGDYAVAAALNSTSTQRAFQVSRARKFAMASIDTEVLEASKGDAFAFLYSTRP